MKINGRYCAGDERHPAMPCEVRAGNSGTLGFTSNGAKKELRSKGGNASEPKVPGLGEAGIWKIYSKGGDE
jgi:hypothetical protein